MHAARDFTRSKKPRNALTGLALHFRLGVNRETAHRMMNPRRDLRGIVRRLIQRNHHFGTPESGVFLRVVGLLVGGKRGFERLCGHLDLLGELIEVLSLHRVAVLVIAAGELVAIKDALIVDEVGIAAGLLQNMLAHDVAGEKFIAEAFTLLVHHNRAAGTHGFGNQVTVALNDGRMDLNLFDVGKRRTDVFTELNALAQSARVVCGGKALQFRTVLRHHRLIGAEAAGRKHHGPCVNRLHAVFGLNLNPGNRAVFHHDFDDLVFSADGNPVLDRALGEHTQDFRAHSRAVTGAVTAGNGLTAASALAEAELRAKVYEPFFRVLRVFRESLQQCRVIEIMPALHRVLVEELRAVLRHARCELLLGACGIHAARSKIGVAADVGHLFQNHNRSAGLLGRNGGGKTCAA